MFEDRQHFSSESGDGTPFAGGAWANAWQSVWDENKHTSTAKRKNPNKGAPESEQVTRSEEAPTTSATDS